jgi:translation initiation factor 4G
MYFVVLQDLSGVVVTGVAEVFDAQRDKDEKLLLDLLVMLLVKKALKVEELVAGLQTYTSQLEDLSLDVPKAPQILGKVWGQCAAEGVVPLGQMEELLADEEGAEAKRKFAAAAFGALKTAGGEGKLKELAGGLKVGELLKAGEFDGDLPTVEDWLKKEGLAGMVGL